MRLTRRQFLSTVFFTAVPAVLLPELSAQEILRRGNKSFDLEKLLIFEGVSSQTFEPWIGSSFRVSLDDRPLGSLILVSVDEPAKEKTSSGRTYAELDPVSTRPGGEASPITTFSLRFRGSGKTLPQETYTLSHDWLGKFLIFLVPSGWAGKHTYTATFTLLNDPVTKETQ